MIERQIIELAEQVYGEILEDSQSFFLHHFKQSTDKSGKTSLDAFFDQRLEESKQDLIQQGKSPLWISDFDSVMISFKNGLATYAGDDLSKCQLELYGSSAEPQGDDLVVPGGMLTLLTALLDELPDDLIEKKQEVVKINYSGSLVNITSKDRESGHFKLYEADFLISTLPIGVMKKQHQSLFEPRLPNKLVSLNC